MFFKTKIIKQKVFTWLCEVQQNIMLSNNNQAYTEMKELVLKNMGSFIEMDPASTVKLCDQWFDCDYNCIVQAIEKYT